MRISTFNIEVYLFGCTFTLSFPFITIITILLLADNNGAIIYGFFAALFHELGHIFAMIWKGHKPQKISFKAFDISIVDRNRIKRNYNDDIFILAAGPLTNAILCIILYLVFRITQQEWLIKPIYENIFIGVFNILPIESLDGGQMLFNLLCRKLNIKTAMKFTVLISFMVLLPVAALGFYILIISKYNFSLLLLSCYLMGILLIKHNDCYY